MAKRMICFLLALGMVLAILPAQALAAEDTVPMYRLYNPNSGEHFYTGSEAERDMLTDVGWNYEGIGWFAPTGSGEPVYRTYNPNAGDHHYTMSWDEVEMLVDVVVAVGHGCHLLSVSLRSGPQAPIIPRFFGFRKPHRGIFPGK